MIVKQVDNEIEILEPNMKKKVRKEKFSSRHEEDLIEVKDDEVQIIEDEEIKVVKIKEAEKFKSHSRKKCSRCGCSGG